MNLKQLALDYIANTGVEAVAADYGVKPMTVSGYFKTQKFPGDFLQFVLDRLQGTSEHETPLKSVPDPEPATMDDVAPSDVLTGLVERMEAVYTAFAAVEGRLGNLDARIQNLEGFAQALSRPQPALPPVPPPQVVTPAPVTAAAISPVFTPIRQLGGDPNVQPAPQPKPPEPAGVGAHMTNLLKPYNYAQRGRR